MADKKISDLSLQNLELATEILANSDLTADVFAKVSGQKIIDLIVAQGYITKTQTEALKTLQSPQMFFGGGELSGNTATITLDTPLVCRDDSDSLNIVLGDSYTKLVNSGFSAGDGTGGLDTGGISANKTYYIFAISTSGSVSDLLFSLSKTAPTMPTGYTYKRLVGAFNTTIYGVSIYDTINYYELIVNGTNGAALPTNFIGEVSIAEDPSYLEFSKMQCRDDTDTVNLGIRGTVSLPLSKDTTVFAEGHNNGMFETAIAKNSLYYIYIIGKENGTEVDVFASLNDPDTVTLPTGFLYKRLIGFYKTLDAVTDLFTWTIHEKWDDENFDIANLAKAKVTVVDAPSYEALFSGSGNTIKCSVFEGGEDEFIDAGKEYAHDGKNDFPIHFHAHCYPDSANAGDIVLFLDYVFTSEGDMNVVTAPTRLTVTAPMPEILGEQKTVNFDWIFDTGLVEGSQIWFTFGRLGTDANDTYTGDVAIRTFGYHYLRDRNGSDLETANI